VSLDRQREIPAVLKPAWQRTGVLIATAFLLCEPVALARQLPHAAMRINGHGPAVVFESGLGEAQRSWVSVVRALASCLTTVTYNRVGIDNSLQAPGSRAPVLAAVVANDLLAALRAHDLPGPYILVGHSIGGLYVQAFARDHPRQVAGVVLVDASSPLEPPGVFVSKVPPKPGSVEAAEEAGVAPSVTQLLAGPPFPPIPLVVIAASDHGDTPEHEALWREVQRRTALLSPKGRLVTVQSGHFVQSDRPTAVVAAILTVAAESGISVATCRNRRS
jgi:pimeloyl-ACP methyl ester carboxylesterase